MSLFDIIKEKVAEFLPGASDKIDELTGAGGADQLVQSTDNLADTAQGLTDTATGAAQGVTDSASEAATDAISEATDPAHRQNPDQ